MQGCSRTRSVFKPPWKKSRCMKRTSALTSRNQIISASASSSKLPPALRRGELPLSYPASICSSLSC